MKVEIHDGKRLVVATECIYILRERGRNNVDAREGPTMGSLDALHLARLHIGPTAQQHLVVEEQVATGLALVHYQRGQLTSLCCLAVELGHVGIAHDVHVVHQDRFVVVKHRQGLAQRASRIEQAVTLVAHPNVDAVVLVGIEELDNLLAEVVHVDDDMLEASRLQFQEVMLQQGTTVHLHQGLGAVIGQGFEARA